MMTKTVVLIVLTLSAFALAAVFGPPAVEALVAATIFGGI